MTESFLLWYINEVDSHKKSRQSDLALEKLWVAQCGWIQLCTTVAMGMAINIFWKIFHYGFKRDHYAKLIGIRELLEGLSIDCFNNKFSTDTGSLAKNTPLLDKVDDGETVSTWHALHFSSSDSCSTEFRQYIFKPPHVEDSCQWQDETRRIKNREWVHLCSPVWASGCPYNL